MMSQLSKCFSEPRSASREQESKPDPQLVEKVEKYEEEIKDLKKKNTRKDDIVVFYKERYDNLEAQYEEYKESNPIEHKKPE